MIIIICFFVLFISLLSIGAVIINIFDKGKNKHEKDRTIE